ncbi:ATP-binding protein, partial [Candidatus Geothermarchaeota archaeon]
RFNIENIEIFKSVFYFTLSNYSNLISYRSINRILKSMGVDIDVKTLINYIGYMKQAFLVYTLEIFSYSQRSRIVNPRKLYVIDVSFSNLFPETLDIGRKIENLVFIELLRRSSPFTDISYYRTKGREEVDFLVRERGYVKDLIEVTYEVQQSHVKKMFKALNELKIKRGTIITWAEEDVIDIKDKCIEVVPLWKWLLKPSAKGESIE